MGSIGEDHVALKRRVAELEDAYAREQRFRARAEESERIALDAVSVAMNSQHSAEARAEQADRERDEWRARHRKFQDEVDVVAARLESKVNHLETQSKELIAAKERAGADNAALRDGLRCARDPHAYGSCGTNGCTCGVVTRLNADHPGAALLEELRALRTFVQGFANMAANAVEHHTGPKTGMRVPYHGDFANLAPSGVSALERWLKLARAALEKTS